VSLCPVLVCILYSLIVGPTVFNERRNDDDDYDVP